MDNIITKKVCVFNLGCKVNQYEGDEILSILKDNGYEAIDGLDYADVYIINTCAVTNEAEKKSRQAVSRALKLNPDAKILICGCASQHNANQFMHLQNVVFCKGVANKIDIIKGINGDKGICVDDLPISYEYHQNNTINKTRANIKITDGCNHFCSYCLIPFLRGRTRSRSIEDIVIEFEKIKQHHKEIVLTGIDISSYGIDIGCTLIDLLQALGDDKTRIRLGSLEVNIINKDLLLTMKNNRSFCPHFHLSLQSGSNSILKKMNRHYTSEHYRDAVNLIREFFPDAGITTDIITGFPTESDKEHNESLKFAEEIAFSDIHVFEYSLRDGTVAAKMQQVDAKVKKQRTDEFILLKNNLKTKFIESQLGKTKYVLYENDGGYTDNYIKVYANGKENELLNTKLTTLYKDGAKGILLGE